MFVRRRLQGLHRPRRHHHASEGRRNAVFTSEQKEAATKIQAIWRGRRERADVHRRRDRKKPWGFYSHTLALTPRVATKERLLARVFTDRRQLWMLLEDPMSSQAAQALSIFIIFTIFVSVLGYVLETVPEIYFYSLDLWWGVECVCTIIFSIEYILHVMVCSEAGYTKLQFVMQPLIICDFLALVPFYVEMKLKLINAILQNGSQRRSSSGLEVLRIIRLVRITRIFKIGRHASGIRLMGEAVRGSWQAISILVYLVCMGVVLFSAAVFYAERFSCPDVRGMSYEDRETYLGECSMKFNRGTSPSFGLCCTDDEEAAPLDFPSIVAAAWWSMVTMTTVGFGDVYPRTLAGRCVGAVAMLVGMVLIALPVAIVGQKFQDCYETFNLHEARRRASTRLRAPGETWCIKDREGRRSTVIHRLRALRPKDSTVAGAISDFASNLEEVWEQREQLTRGRHLQWDQQGQVLSRVNQMTSLVDRAVTTMSANPASPRLVAGLSSASP
mmetsp:Transcript_49307/g.110571  ORF Transcript_49307/g.110571 Transcript_49307/m.110571 type:complete len:501 (+) Transcript_49307:94-1596(+)